METLRGRLLVASPKLVDPNFRRTIVLVGEHGEEGAMGVVLNRPTQAPVAEAAPGVAELAPGDVVHVGGPVQPEAVLVLAEAADPSVASDLLVGDVGFLRGDLDLSLLVAGARRARVFAGYAGWGAGQLEEEIGSGDWLVETPVPEDVFAPRGRDLWADVVRRKGGQWKLVATMPFDPTLN